MIFRSLRSLTRWLGCIVPSVFFITACGESPPPDPIPLDSGQPDAPTREASAPDGSSGVVGTLGEPCDMVGALGCAGNDQKGQLICNPDHRWASNGVCAGATNCDTRAGNSAGSCQPIVPECAMRAGGDAWCVDVTVKSCDADRVTFLEQTCSACLDGHCVDCAPGAKRCGSTGSPESCDAKGHWVTQPACGATVPNCVAGECRPCRPQEARCVGSNRQVCDGAGSWGPSEPCQFTCAAGACTGECYPNELRCSTVPVGTPQYCSGSNRWEAFPPTQGSDWHCDPGCSDPRFRVFLGPPSGDQGYVSRGPASAKWEIRARAAATLNDASAACASKGRRLPTRGELELLKLTLSSPPRCSPNIDQTAFEVDRSDQTGYAHWSADAASNAGDGGVTTSSHLVVYFADKPTAPSDDTTLLPYRCVWP